MGRRSRPLGCHRRNVAWKGGKGGRGNTSLNPDPPQGRRPHPTQRNLDAIQYDEDGYILDAGTRNWPHGRYNTSHWQDGEIPYDTRRGGPWSSRMPMRRPIAPRPRYLEDRGHIVDHVYMDRDCYSIEHPVRRNMYRDVEHHGYGRAPTRYADNEPLVDDAPPLLPPVASSLQAYPLAPTGLPQAPSHDEDRPPACTPNETEDVYSFEHFNPESSAMKSAPTAVDTAQPVLYYKKGRHPMLLVCEKEESDRIARGLKPFWVECNSAGIAIETGRSGTRFLEVFRAFCIDILDVSIIRVRDQNIEDYARLREKVEAEIECIGHPMSDEGFFNAVSKCMKGERSRLHKLYMSQPERGCPPTERPEVWERLKKYWSSLEYGKVAKVGSAATPEDVTVNTEPAPPQSPIS